jgi:hypothetical protein
LKTAKISRWLVARASVVPAVVLKGFIEKEEYLSIDFFYRRHVISQIYLKNPLAVNSDTIFFL